MDISRNAPESCDACNAPARVHHKTLFGVLAICCEAHYTAAVDALLDIDEDCCDPLPECGCK